MVSTTYPRRPDVPAELTAEQAQVWRDTVATMPATWFDPATFPLLIGYCRHVATADRLARLIDQHEDFTDLGTRRFSRLLGMHERETRAATYLATKMRLTHQARYRGELKQERRRGVAPWEVGL